MEDFQGLHVLDEGKTFDFIFVQVQFGGCVVHLDFHADIQFSKFIAQLSVVEFDDLFGLFEVLLQLKNIVFSFQVFVKVDGIFIDNGQAVILIVR